MFRSCRYVVLLMVLLVFQALTGSVRSEAPLVTLSADGKPWSGDLDGMIERRTIRVLVPNSKTLYFIDVGGNQRGISYELMREFDEALNKKLKTGNLRINFQFIPLARDKLIPALLEGRGDIVAANLTVTPELGVGDIHEIDANIHAGVKYIRFMIDHYYADEPMDDENKLLFAFAAYNAGPGRVRSLRREAVKRDLDPNLWFDNVEYVAADRIGRETVQYVRNVYKYYITYKLMFAQLEERKEAVLP